MITRISLAARTSRTGIVRPSRVRFLATNNPQRSPSPKICVLPFRQNPHDVAERFHTFALILSAQIGNFFAATLRMGFGPIGAWIAKTLNLGGPMRMREMKAVYYPVWKVDVIYEGKVKHEKRDETANAMICAHQAYVPGNSFAPLSYLSFGQPILEPEIDLPVYDPDIHLKQLGDGFDIVPVPFTASPLGLLKKIENAVGPRPRLGKTIFDKSTWKPTLFACYPIMMPIYIADFEYESAEGEPRSMFLVMDAYGEKLRKCRISGPPAPEVAAQTPRLKNNFYMNPGTFVPDATIVNPFALEDLFEGMSDKEVPRTVMISVGFGGRSSKFPSTLDLVAAYDSWMSPKPMSETSIPPSPLLDVEQEEGGVNWNDPRIQSWNSDDRGQNEDYYGACIAADSATRFADKQKEMEQRHEVEEGVGETSSSSEDKIQETNQQQFNTMMNELLEKAEESKMAAIQYREDAKPGWMRALEESQGGDATPKPAGEPEDGQRSRG